MDGIRSFYSGGNVIQDFYFRLSREEVNLPLDM